MRKVASVPYSLFVATMDAPARAITPFKKAGEAKSMGELRVLAGVYRENFLAAYAPGALDKPLVFFAASKSDLAHMFPLAPDKAPTILLERALRA